MPVSSGKYKPERTVLEVGDKVRGLYMQDMVSKNLKKFHKYLWKGREYLFFFVGNLDNFCGKTFYIESILESGVIYLKGFPFPVSNEMIVPVY